MLCLVLRKGTRMACFLFEAALIPPQKLVPCSGAKDRQYDYLGENCGRLTLAALPGFCLFPALGTNRV